MKSKQDLDPTLVELKRLVDEKKIEVFEERLNPYLSQFKIRPVVVNILYTTIESGSIPQGEVQVGILQRSI